MIVLRLWWRGRVAPEYRLRWRERFGAVDATPEKPVIWVHAVSVGETLAAVPMIKALQLKYPDHHLYITSTTPTGSERVKASFGDSVSHSYLPYDLPWFYKRFLKALKPSVAVIMETELWPNMLAVCAQSSVPVVIANARLSEKSARGYQRFSVLTADMLQHVTLVAAQFDEDAHRFAELGVSRERLAVTGNIKFDLDLEKGVVEQGIEFRKIWQGEGRPVWLAASTHEGEDAVLLSAHRLLHKSHPNALLALVPRHPERFDQVYQLALSEGFKTQRHSDLKSNSVEVRPQVVVGNTMGELLSMIAGSDLVFMGGTLVANGGHNYIEPAALGKPILSGPSRFNFRDISDQLIDAEVLKICEEDVEIASALSELFNAPEEIRKIAHRAMQLAEQNRGALARLLTALEPILGAES